MKRPQCDRQPSGRQHLDVRQLGLRRPVWTECVIRAGNRGGDAAARQPAHERVHAGPGERERGQKRDVVGEDRIAADPVDGRDQKRNAEQIFGIRERAEIREIDRRVPHAGESVAQTIGIPRDHPRCQQCVEKVGGQRPCGMLRQRQSEDDARKREERRRDRNLPPSQRRGNAAGIHCLGAPAVRSDGWSQRVHGPRQLRREDRRECLDRFPARRPVLQL